jgi:hypothetical protein
VYQSETMSVYSASHFRLSDLPDALFGWMMNAGPISADHAKAIIRLTSSETIRVLALMVSVNPVCPGLSSKLPSSF